MNASPTTGAGTPSGGGLFLAFEGVEGSGKSTQARLLADRLRSAGSEVVLAREPGSTPLGERIRQLFLGEAGIAIPPVSELFLILAARAAFVERVVAPALAAGQVVIADRFELSTLAYQGAGRGVPLEVILECNRVATRGVSPHVTVLLDLPPEEGARRQALAAKAPDRMEAEARDFHQRVARGYREFAGRVDGLVSIDASGSIDEVRARVEDVLKARLAPPFSEPFRSAGVIS
jgi:dTMP kinase